MFGNSTPTGSEGCQCLNTNNILASLTERSCQTPGGETGVLLAAEGPCVPHSYGSSTCLQHDFLGQSKTEVYSKCQEIMPGNPDDTDYCSLPWCYVDPKSCMLSSERLHRSMYFSHDAGVDLFYSYTTCDSSLDDGWSIPTKRSLGGITIMATCPTAYFPPYNYKRSPSGDILAVAGEGHYDNSVPYEGVLINYLKSLQEISDGDFNISFTYGSKASKLVHPTSAYTAAVQDVEDGLVDMVVAPSWVTGQRLQMAAFTVPLYYSRTVLVIPKPSTVDTLGAQVGKVLEPFTWWAWVIIIAIISLAAFLSVWFSDGSKVAKERFSRRLSFHEGKRRSKSVYARLVLDAIIQNGIFFCSAGINQEEGDNLPHKILMLGFGGFILIVVSAYVANLAAFLTKSGVLDYVGTLDEVKAKGKRVCALPALKTELEISHPTATFVFSNAGKSYYGLIDDYDAKDCDFIAVGKEDAKTNIELMNMFCERNLVFTDSLIIENQVAFPIRPDLAAGLSYWIYQGAKYHGISVDASQKEYDVLYKRQATCQDFEFNAQESVADDYTQITPNNLFLPIIFFLALALIATSLKLWVRREKKLGNINSLAGRTASLIRLGPAEKRHLQYLKDAEKSDCEAQDTTKAPMRRVVTFATDVDVKCSYEEDNAMASRYNDTTKAIENRRNSTDSDTILMDEFYGNPSQRSINFSPDVDETCSDEEDNATNGISRHGDATKAKRRDSTDSNTPFLDEFYNNPSPAVVQRKRPFAVATDVGGTWSDEEDKTEYGTSRLEQLVETGVFDEILACVQEIKRQKEN